MAATKPRYRTKSEWASAQAARMRSQAHAAGYESSGGSTCRARRKYAGIAAMHREAARYEQLAVRYRERGI
jgi:hypothetical protein